MQINELVADRAKKIIAAIEARAPLLASKPEQVSRHFAAAGLLRCCVLLRGILVLRDANLPNLGHILARQHWETWLLSFHALMRGHEAMQQIGADDVYWRRQLAKKLELGIDYEPDWSGKEQKLNYWKLANQLPDVLKEAGEPEVQAGMNPYTIAYAVPSLFAVHANLATVSAHIIYGDDAWSITSSPAEALPDPAVAPTLHTAHLARYVLKEFGVSDDGGVEVIGDEVLAAVQQDAAASAGNLAS
jgi:hypothetical protein